MRAWCEHKGLPINSSSRSEYAAERVRWLREDED